MSAADALGNARVPRAGDSVLATADFSWRKSHAEYTLLTEQKIVSARRRNQHAGRARYPVA